MTVKDYIDLLEYEIEIITIEGTDGHTLEHNESYLLSDKYFDSMIDKITTEALNTLTPHTVIRLAE